MVPLAPGYGLVFAEGGGDGDGGGGGTVDVEEMVPPRLEV